MKKNRILIADVTIDFCSEVEIDLQAISSVYRHHIIEDDGEPAMYKVDFVDSDKKFQVPDNMKIEWEGGAVCTINPARVYGSRKDGSIYVLVSDEVLIEHKPAERHTICRVYVERKKKLFGFSRKSSVRPMTFDAIYIITQMVLSVFGKYALHGCCVSKNNAASVFLGSSGAGKSTLSTMLAEIGYDFMGDDVVYVGKDENGQYMVYSSLNDVKLYNKLHTKKNQIDIIKTKKVNYCYKSKIKTIFLMSGDFYNKQTQIIRCDTDNLYATLVRASNNALMQYDKSNWLQLYYELSQLPSYVMVFGNKKYFDPSIIENPDA